MTAKRPSSASWCFGWHPCSGGFGERQPLRRNFSRSRQLLCGTIDTNSTPRRKGNQRRIVQSIIFPDRRATTPPSRVKRIGPDVNLRLRHPPIISPALLEGSHIASCTSPTLTTACSSGSTITKQPCGGKLRRQYLLF